MNSMFFLIQKEPKIQGSLQAEVKAMIIFS